MIKSNRIYITWLKWPILIRMAVFVLLVIILFGTVISWIEPKEFTTVFEGIWWALVTVSSVGYGDFAPRTTAGQVLGMLLIFVGVGIFSAYFASISSATFHKQHRYSEGKVRYEGSDHLIVVGWNEKSNKLIHTILAEKRTTPIVLIDDTLKEAPLINNLHFIRGNATDKSVLERANTARASSAIITADQHKNESDADMLTVLILLALKGCNRGIYAMVEIVTDTQVKNAELAGADYILNTSNMICDAIMEHRQEEKR